MEIKVIGKDEARSYLGRPVWYESTENANEFGWTFIHPDSIRMKANLCRLIPANPSAKDFYGWDAVRLYNKPAIRGICAHCTHWQKEQLIRCELQGEGRHPEGCKFSNQYKNFEPTPFWKERGYTAKTFIRQLKISGCQIREKEKSC